MIYHSTHSNDYLWNLILSEYKKRKNTTTKTPPLYLILPHFFKLSDQWALKTLLDSNFLAKKALFVNLAFLNIRDVNSASRAS